MLMQSTQKKPESAQPVKIEHVYYEQHDNNQNDASIRNGMQMSDVKHITPFTLDPVTMGLKKQDKLESVLQQNKKLRIINKQLRKQLEVFEKRLDETLKKRTVSQKKPRVAKQVVQSMELKNAYKQCEIYKKQIFQLKKKQSLFDEQKLHNLTNQLSQYQIQKQKLLQEIKSLKKLTKQQEKGLVQLTGNTSFVKVLKQVQELKEQNRKLLEKRNKQERETKLTKITVNNQKRRAKQEQMRNSEQKKKQEEKQNSQVEILKQKADKDSKKIIFLISDNNKLLAQCQDLKRQLEQKDKQISALRLRLGVLRKQARIKQSRLETEPSKVEKQQQGMVTHRSKNAKHEKYKSQFTDSQFLTQPPSQSKETNKKAFVKYPKLLEAGMKKQSSVKWNHHQFSSKIKQVQIATNISGYIGQINFRYEKGQPAPTGISKSNFIKFVCQQNTGEYVKSIKGGFKQQLLMFIKVQTNKGRIQKIGKLDSESQCIVFTFGQLDNQYPGAFFGEVSQQGINRLGCLLQCIK